MQSNVEKLCRGWGSNSQPCVPQWRTTPAPLLGLQHIATVPCIALSSFHWTHTLYLSSQLPSGRQDVQMDFRAIDQQPNDFEPLARHAAIRR